MPPRSVPHTSRHQACPAGFAWSVQRARRYPPGVGHEILLRGHALTLRTLRHADIPALHALAPIETFRYFLTRPDDDSPAAFARWIEHRLTGPRQHALLVLDEPSERALGCTSLLDLDPENRSLEIGATWYAPECRGRGVNPACKLLLLRHAFEDRACLRVTLKCDARNEPSRRAILALGATFEGVLRSHRILPDGARRDTAYFSILAEEWARVRDHLLARLRAHAGRYHRPHAPSPSHEPAEPRPPRHQDLEGPGPAPPAV